jgi:hypothetical protein
MLHFSFSLTAVWFSGMPTSYTKRFLLFELIQELENESSIDTQLLR